MIQSVNKHLSLPVTLQRNKCRTRGNNQIKSTVRPDQSIT